MFWEEECKVEDKDASLKEGEGSWTTWRFLMKKTQGCNSLHFLTRHVVTPLMVRSTKINENHFATVRVGATLYLYHLHRIGAMTLDFQPGTF
ncbi:hypothetical protein DAPPUDRAFT_244221 [Daphnia pulex]|uniref:Uncharacterized protein n=1 Tax=Daphnia pulex TaxID=6669 RepID=E9GKG9_DAPPU|nr:hypothetical protein DAPPUDRAFT_244221 [Daphnia pulex]|eukprot:EFX79990.1 hypothetical protein DAPPUDRAFT_244221 [Daphnia pulex]